MQVGPTIDLLQAIRETPGLSMAAVAVGSMIASRLDKQNRCFPSALTIAKDAGCSVSTVWRAIKELKAAGLLIVEAGGGVAVNRYHGVPCHPDMTPCHPDTATRVTLTHEVVQGSSTRSRVRSACMPGSASEHGVTTQTLERW